MPELTRVVEIITSFKAPGPMLLFANVKMHSIHYEWSFQTELC